MNLYLVRHGKAEPGEDDYVRPLTERGRSAVEAVAKRLRKAGIYVDRIEHSGLLRAEQTAEILHASLGGEMVEAPDLHPDDDVADAAERLQDAPEDEVMLVGHLPFMERLVSYLVMEDPSARLLDMATGSAVLLSDDGDGWTVRWFVTPAIVSSG